MITELASLYEKEGWAVEADGRGGEQVVAYGEKFPAVHPFAIHSKLYRESENPEIRYMHFKAMHDYMWPETIWHYWTERRFREHCKGWGFITYAAGASASKSYDSAKIAILFWLANPKERTVVIASTSLESLSTRIWGYVTKHLNKSALFHPITQLGGQSPKVLYDYKKEGRKMKDTIHGMFAVSAKQGEDEKVISSWIGRHPDDAMMLVLDEATDMPPALVKALPNLEQGVNFFQGMAIGNSNSRFDLHGALSTPADGWDSVDPKVDTWWRTTQKNGICLFFSCYESPAIFETDPVRREKLSKFLITQEEIDEKEKLYGKDSDSFWRMVLGFWRSDSTDETVISRKFITDFDVFKKAEWSGLYPLNIVAGLDPAFSTGGDQCVLRLGILGVDSNGLMCLDFRENELLFRVRILAAGGKSADIQIAEEVNRILRFYQVNMRDLAVDASGQGRALAEVIKLHASELWAPIKIYSTKASGPVTGFKHVGDVVVKSNHELWFAFRDFIQHGQIRGLDKVAATQLTSRLVHTAYGKQQLEPKRDYKNRMGAISPSLAHSPDEADAAALCLQAAIINYGFSPGQKRTVRKMGLIDDKFQTFQMLHGIGGEGLKEKALPPVASFEHDISSLVDTKDRFSNF